MNSEVCNERGMQHYNNHNNERGMQLYSNDPYRSSYPAPSSYAYHTDQPYHSKESKKSKSWNFRNDPEMKRKQRVASYKVFTVEGKVKSSVRNSFRWIKNKYMEMRYGWF